MSRWCSPQKAALQGASATADAEGPTHTSGLLLENWLVPKLNAHQRYVQMWNVPSWPVQRALRHESECGMWGQPGLRFKSSSLIPTKPWSRDTRLGLSAFFYHLVKTAPHHILKIHEIIEKPKSRRGKGKKKNPNCSVVNVTFNSNYLTHTKLSCITYNSPTLCRLLCFYFK